MDTEILVAGAAHVRFAQQVCNLIEHSAKVRGTGIATRDVDYIKQKIKTGHAVIAISGDQLQGFCYIETWEHNRFVANSGLVVHPDYRNKGMARLLKSKVFELAQEMYPDSKIFGITTSAAVMKINSELGYRPVTFSELTKDQTFWKGCQSCPNYSILQKNKTKMCLCTGMLAPSKNKSAQSNIKNDK